MSVNLVYTNQRDLCHSFQPYQPKVLTGADENVEFLLSSE